MGGDLGPTIGGGAIVKQGGAAHGTATAAAIWGTGAIGAAVAFHRYEIAVRLPSSTSSPCWPSGPSRDSFEVGAGATRRKPTPTTTPTDRTYPWRLAMASRRGKCAASGSNQPRCPGTRLRSRAGVWNTRQTLRRGALHPCAGQKDPSAG
jgi:hypothetical protein